MGFEIAVLISGRGSNLASLIANARHYTIKAVLSSKADAPGLAHGQAAGIHCSGFSTSTYGSVKLMKCAIWEAVRGLKPDLLVLAGFMLIVDKNFTEEFNGKIVNIHPSLLPAYTGLATHQRALAAGETRHGCSVHYVDSGIDTGPPIAQAACHCLPNDTEAELAARVLALEHRLYPWVINLIAQGSIRLENGCVRYSNAALEQASLEDFIVFPK